MVTIKVFTDLFVFQFTCYVLFSRVILYLSDVEEGGELNFLDQQKNLQVCDNSSNRYLSPHITIKQCFCWIVYLYLFNNTFSTFLINGYFGVGHISIGCAVPIF